MIKTILTTGDRAVRGDVPGHGGANRRGEQRGVGADAGQPLLPGPVSCVESALVKRAGALFDLSSRAGQNFCGHVFAPRAGSI